MKEPESNSKTAEGGSGQGPGESGACFLFRSPALPCDTAAREKRKLGQRS